MTNLVDFTHRNYAIASYLVHGHTPWGVSLKDAFDAGLSDCGGEWIMCCGHVLTDDEAKAWASTGLARIAETKDRLGRDRLVANGQQTLNWLNDCWDALGGDYQYEDA